MMAQFENDERGDADRKAERRVRLLLMVDRMWTFPYVIQIWNGNYRAFRKKMIEQLEMIEKGLEE